MNPTAEQQQASVDISQSVDIQKRIVDRVRARFRAGSQFDRPFKDKCMIGWKNRNQILPNNWPFYSDIFEPETTIACNDTVEQIMGSLFGKDQYFDVRPGERQDKIQTEKMRELTRAAHHRLKYKIKVYQMMDEATCNGNAVLQHFVRPRVVKTYQRMPMIDEFGMLQGYNDVEDSHLEWWPDAEVISRYDQYPGPTGDTIQKMPWFQFKRLVPVAWLNSQKWAGWMNVDKLQPFVAFDRASGNVTMEDDDLAYELEELLRAVGMDVKAGSVHEASDNKDVALYSLLLYHYEARDDGEEGGGKACVIGNWQYLMKEWQVNPHRHELKPFSEFKFAPRSTKLWQAWGLPELMLGLQKKINMRSNQASDAILLNNRPPILVTERAGISDLTSLDYWPGRKIRCTDASEANLRFFQQPQVGQELWVDLDVSRAGIQRLSRVLDVTRGLSGRRTGVGEAADTAKGQELMIGEQQKAMSFKMLRAEEEGLSEGNLIIGSDIQQVFTREQEVRLVGDGVNETLMEAGFENPVPISPEDIAGIWDFRAVGSSRTLEDPEMAKTTQSWLDRGLMDPEIAPWIKRVEGWKAVGEMIGVPRPSRFMRTKEEAAIAQQQMLQAQANAAAQAAVNEGGKARGGMGGAKT